MAIFHLSVSTIGRRAGRSATAAAAYRAGERVQDVRTNTIHDYSGRTDVAATQILTPPDAPTWANDRQSLWNAAELAERRVDARVAREITLALPRELPPDVARDVVLGFVQEHCVAQGMVADVAIHDEGGTNPHCHILLTTRTITEDGFGLKNRSWDSRACVLTWRERWAAAANEALATHGSPARIDHRSLADQGVNRLPTVHLGPRWTALNREYPDTPMDERDQRTQANAAIAGMNGPSWSPRASTAKVNPARAARAASMFYEQQIAQWKARNDAERLRRLSTVQITSPVRALEQTRGYQDRHDLALRHGRHVRRLEGVVRGTALDPARMIAAQLALEAARREQQTARDELALWSDKVRPRIVAASQRLRESRHGADVELRKYEGLVAQHSQWMQHVETSIPEHLRHRRAPPPSL